MGLIARMNDALNINPPAGDEYLTVNGSNWLWAVTAIYIVSMIATIALSYKAPAGERIFHYMFTVTLLVGSLTYFAEASDLGWILVATQKGTFRQIFYAKYINWVVLIPNMILTLGLLSGISWATIVFNIFLAWILQIAYLCCVLTISAYKWGFIGFAGFTLCLLLVNLSFACKDAKRVGSERYYHILNGFAQLTMSLYISGVTSTDGSNSIGVTSTFIWFGIVDIITGPLFAFVTLYMSRSLDYNKLNIIFTQYGRARQGGDFPEKQPAPRGEAAA